MGPDFNFQKSLRQAVTISGLLVGALLGWFILALVKSGILFWVDGSVFGFADWLNIPPGLFRFEAFCLLAWLFVDLLRWGGFLVGGNFRAGLIGGSARAVVLSLFSGVIGLLIYFLILSPGEPKEGRRYHSSDLAAVLMAEEAEKHFAPTTLEQVQKKSVVSEQGKALADSLIMGQLVALILVILFWYGVLVKQSLSAMHCTPVVRTTMYAFYEDRMTPRGGEMNNR